MNWSSETIERPPQSRVGSWVSDTPDSASEGHQIRGMDQVLAPDVGRLGCPAAPGLPSRPIPSSCSTSWPCTSAGSIRRLRPEQGALHQRLPGRPSEVLLLHTCQRYFSLSAADSRPVRAPVRTGKRPVHVGRSLLQGVPAAVQPGREPPLFDHHQALGIMSIREASCGRDSESWYYAGQSIRLAIEMGLHRIQGEGRR